jgi:hypothetical protein
VSTEENEKDREYIGLTGVYLASIDDEVIFTQVFIRLFCKDIDEMTAQVNAAIVVYNHEKRFSLRKIKHLSMIEIIIAFALMIGDGDVGGNGCMMWRANNRKSSSVIASSRCQTLKNWGCHTGGLNSSASSGQKCGKIKK